MNKIGKYLTALLLAVSVVAAVGCAGTSKQSSTGEYVDDAVITTRVKAALIKDETVKATEVNVETFKGAVQLSGFVSSQVAANKAVEITRGISGVKSVRNDMRIK